MLTGNYGEAGAVERSGPALGLPPVCSGHDGFHAWGPPPASSAPVIAVGLDQARLRELFTDVEPVARTDDGVSLDDDEQGHPVWLCRGSRGTWSEVWPGLRRLG